MQYKFNIQIQIFPVEIKKQKVMFVFLDSERQESQKPYNKVVNIGLG
jgi:hypothetical protein